MSQRGLNGSRSGKYKAPREHNQPAGNPAPNGGGAEDRVTRNMSRRHQGR